MMNLIPDNGWAPFFAQEREKEYYRKLSAFVEEAYETGTVFPPKERIFNAFLTTDIGDVRVVILGQDPYHEVGQAHGLSFSVQKGIPLPPSLQNIYKELKSDLGIEPPSHGDLSSWAYEGVLLLNATLTVREGMANSHQSIGWQIFTDRIISLLNDADEPIVFLLWGSNARQKASLITNPKHKLLSSAHPSPLSAYRGFFGSRPFSKINDFLKSVGRTPINWEIQ